MSVKRILKHWENPAPRGAADDETPGRECLSFRETPTPLAPFVRDLTSLPVAGTSPHARTTRAPGFKRGLGGRARSTDDEALCSVVADVPARTTENRSRPVSSQGTVRGEQSRNADDFQAMLCAELLSSLSQKQHQQQQPHRIRNDGPHTIAPSHTTGLHDTSMVQEIYQDSEVIDFTHRISRFAAKTGMTPFLVLSCVLSESLRSDGRPATVAHPDRERGERGQLSRVLFDIVWRQHLSSCDPSSNVPSVVDETRRLGVMAATNRKREVNDSVGHKERIRQEKVQRWKEKKKSRNFAAKIRYPARQHLANARKRYKGQFVSNKVTVEDTTESSQA